MSEFGEESDSGNPDVPAYRHMKKIAEGGMSTVYAAYDRRHDRNVAIKLLARSKIEGSAKDRFRQEIRTMGRLSGRRNLVPVLDSGFTLDGVPYLVMPLMAGGTLADRSPINWREACRVGSAMSSGLQAIHEIDVLHRDIKPSNVLFGSFEDEPMLGDFGISSTANPLRSETVHRATTMAFAAPEVLMGDRPTKSSDVYSVGATLFAAVEGSPPHPGASEAAIYQAIADSSDPPRPTVPCPPQFEELLGSMMAIDPDERPQSLAEIKRRFDELLAGPEEVGTDTVVRPRGGRESSLGTVTKGNSLSSEPTKSANSRLMVAAGGFILVAAAILGTWAVVSNDGTGTAGETSTATPEVAGATEERGEEAPAEEPMPVVTVAPLPSVAVTETTAVLSTTVLPTETLGGCVVSLRGGVELPADISCDGGSIVATGDLGAGWNGILASWVVDGSVEVEAIWEEWSDDGTKIESSGVETWSSTGVPASDGAAFSYQELKISLGPDSTLTILGGGASSDKSVTFSRSGVDIDDTALRPSSALISCDPVDLRSGLDIPSKVQCETGYLEVSGDLAVPWNEILSSHQIDGGVVVDALWEAWFDGESEPRQSGVETWVDGVLANEDALDRYQQLDIRVDRGGSVTIWENIDLTGSSVTFTYVPTTGGGVDKDS